MIHHKNNSINNNSGKVQINGKTYQTVAYRIAEFRKKYPVDSGWSIETECVQANEAYVIFKATIKNPEGKIISTGHAEEKRDASRINKTSALENAETSAIGRALASAGFIGSEIASADEVVLAIEQQKKQDKVPTEKHPTKVQKKKPSCILPDVTKVGWENFEVPKQLLPFRERNRPIKWIELILDKINLQGKKRIFSGAQHLHAIENWKHPFVQSKEIQLVIKSALDMRERIKLAISGNFGLVGDSVFS